MSVTVELQDDLTHFSFRIDPQYPGYHFVGKRHLTVRLDHREMKKWVKFSR